MFYFIRHGKTDYSEIYHKIYQGFGVNLAPLSESGIQEIQKTSKDRRLQGTDIILSSPYTRALQTAAILSRELDAPVAVETDLHEWLANKAYIYEDDETVTRMVDGTPHHYKNVTFFAWEQTDAVESVRKAFGL